ncbi:MAG: copper amine oxidase protein, partial [Paenibacillaceae bacterium]|nr:copper amine oxidase protein [Paenibacillaceae bacterium]
MKKSVVIIAACAMSVSLMSGSVFAKSENANNGSSGVEVNANVQAKAEGQANGQANGQAKVEGQATVTSSTYEEHGHQGFKGLLNAIENVKDKAAGAVIAEKLLSDYNVELSAEMKAELQAIDDQATALSAAADVLADNGKVDDA